MNRTVAAALLAVFITIAIDGTVSADASKVIDAPPIETVILLVTGAITNGGGDGRIE